MRAVVFVKQVPDLRVGSVGTRPDGTIDRGSAPVITNPADLHALEAAVQAADHVTAITMGPPGADETLREAIAHGASAGVLASDRAFAGSDTWATANVLAAVVRHLGDFDLLLCGVSALDGETGQVGPQIAERLGVPQATGCEAIDVVGGRVRARRVIEGGYETLTMPLPALVTIAETGFTPRYPTFALRRRAAGADIVRLSGAELDLAPGRTGLAGSPTKVAHMENLPLPAVETQFVGRDLSYQQLVAALRDRDALRGHHPGLRPPIATGWTKPELDPDDRPTAVLVACELSNGHLSAVSAELLTAARSLASDLDGGVAAFVAGHGLDGAVADARTFGADTVLVADDERLDPYRCLPYCRVLHAILVEHRPQAVLFGATSTGRDLAPRVAARLDTGLAADCTGLHIADWNRQGNSYERLLHQERPAMAGSVLATCVCPAARPQMATVRPGVFAASPAPRRSRVIAVDVELGPEDLGVEIVDREVRESEVRLSDAAIIVAGGAGCSAENWHLVDELAQALGGRVAASRAAVAAGLAPRALQVGQTGTTVRPDLYVACGISGAFQHVVGMQAAGTVVGVNRDPDAAIFRFAHFGIVGDVVDVLPRLSGALRGSQS